MKVTLKPVEIAAQCNVTSNSIRNWSREFREYLSEGANAPERYYTERDATVLRYISTLKQEGMKTPEIVERLAEMTFGEVETIESPLAQTPPANSNKALAAQPALQESSSNDFAAIVALNDLRNEFTAKLATLEAAAKIPAQRWPDRVLGFCIGVAFTLVLIVILIAMGYFAFGR